MVSEGRACSTRARTRPRSAAARAELSQKTDRRPSFLAFLPSSTPTPSSLTLSRVPSTSLPFSRNLPSPFDRARHPPQLPSVGPPFSLAPTMKASLSSTSVLGALLLVFNLRSALACKPQTHQFGRREEGSAGEIGLSGESAAEAIAAYKCDPSTCKLPACRCVRSPLLSSSPRVLTFKTPRTFSGEHGRSGGAEACAFSKGNGLVDDCAPLESDEHSALPSQEETPMFIVFTA